MSWPDALACVDSLYRTALRLSLVPWPLRPALWWGALNVFGSVRSYHFGTFSTTSVGSQGAGVLHVPTPLTSTLHYGTFDLTDEPLDEPPRRFHAEAARRGLEPDRVWTPPLGDTRPW